MKNKINEEKGKKMRNKKIRTKIRRKKWNKILSDKIKKINANDKKIAIKKIRTKLDTKIKCWRMKL